MANGKLYETMLQQMEKRNAEMRRLRASGWKLERLAARFRVSKQRVHQLTKAE